MNVRIFDVRKNHVPLVVGALILGIGLRFFLAYRYHGNFDMDSYKLVSEIMADGGNVYAYTDRYNYSPVWAYVLLFLRNLSLALGLSFHFAVRGFLTLVDLVVALLIALNARKFSSVPGAVAFSVYLLNPVAILTIGYHGQFENLALVPLLLATYIFDPRKGRRSSSFVWFLGTCALVIKHITLFGVWTLFIYASKRRRNALLMMVGSVFLFLLTLLPFWSEGRTGILINVLLYQSISSQYGLGLLFPNLITMPIFAVLMVLLPLIAKSTLKLSLAKAMELVFVAFLALTHGIGQQYFILPIIWGGIYLGFWYWLFSFVTTLFLLGSPNNVNLIRIPQLWNAVWGTVTAWFLSYFVTWKDGLAALLHPAREREASSE